MSKPHIHPTALVETRSLGAGSCVWAFTHILAGSRIGNRCNIGDHCFIESGVRIGDNVTIKNGNMLWEGIRLDEGVFVGPNVFFINDLYPRSRHLPEARAPYRNTENWLVRTRV